MAELLKNKFVRPKNGLDFSRSLFPYEKRHSTNLLSGYIVPVHTEFLYPGMSPDFNFGCVVESAPLISTNLDNIYVDIVCVWSPMRLVMTDWNEFLGESHAQAFTINRSIVIPKITDVVLEYLPDGNNGYYKMSRAYLAEHYIAPHVGLRYHGDFETTNINAGSIFKKGISVLPSRIYENNWNFVFRNENIQAPILIDKTSTVGSHDATYGIGLGELQIANKLKNFYTVATPAPSLMDVSLALGDKMPITTTYNVLNLAQQDGTSPVNGAVKVASGNLTDTSGNYLAPINAFADLAGLTVNKMYYALMLQRFANKMMKGRRATEFYDNFFGIKDSDAGHDQPEIICHKRFSLNISQVIATANSTDIQNNDQPIGSRGAYSVTGFGGKLIDGFMATEHGYIQTYMIIRGQPSLSTGIDHHLGYDDLLSTYLPNFDHIGPVGIESLEIGQGSWNPASLNFGFTNAWYFIRKQVSDVVGILEPDEPLAYKTLSLSYSQSYGLVINDSFLRFVPTIMDRIFLFPVCYSPANTDCDDFGEPYDSNRYQFLTQFVVKGNLAAVMSPDSEPLQLRL